MTKRLEHRIAWRFGLSAAVLILVSVVAVSALVGSITTGRRIARTHLVLIGLERVLSLVKDAETGQRGYLLTGREEYLQPHTRATAALGLQLDELERLLAESTADRPRLRHVRALIGEKVGELDATIKLRRTRGLDEALRIVMTDRGSRAMTALRGEIAALGAEQQRAREAELRRGALSSRVALTALTLGVVVSLLLLLFAQRIITLEMDRRRQTEEDLKRARVAAEAASRAKGEFLANMSHEIRTPMNGILGMTELALGTRLSDQQREYLGLVKSSADALLEVIDDILDFSKIEAGKLQLSPAPFDLRNVCSDTVRALAVRAHQKGLELALRVSPDIPAAAIGDAGRFRQVLTNLVGNAIKFTDRGEVAVSVDVEESQGTSIVLRVAVADTGIGVPPEKRHIIFSAFEQADGSTTRRFGGTGLGLTISARLVAMMGGSIRVDDNPGGGSIFVFTVRLDDGGEAQPSRSISELTVLTGLRVLIVDDNRTNRLILEELMTLWGAWPCAVDGGAAALDALHEAVEARRPFDVILLDRMMPVMDGLELAERVCLDPRFDSIKMMMLTSAGGLAEGAHCATLGIAECLTKPVRQSELFDALIGLFDRAVERPGIEGGAPGAGPVPSPRPNVRRARILLAEDHPVNQRVAAAMLEQFGHEVTVVGDGRTAVQSVADREFDLVLMDVQMPVMDGFEAVAAIRERERLTGGHTRIVALTAHALAGDRQRCLNGGFDGYLSKPVRASALSELIDGITVAAPNAAEIGERGCTPVAIFDRHSALIGVGGDECLLDEILGLFLEEGAGFVSQLHEAVARGDGAAVKRLAHATAGAAGHCAASCVETAARRLEAIGDQGELTGAADACAALENAFAQFRGAVAPGLAASPRATEHCNNCII